MHSTEISVAARYAELPCLVADLASQAGRCGLSATSVARLQLIVEELFINTISHGYGGDSDEIVTIRLTPAPHGITLHYEDGAPAFDLSRADARKIAPDSRGGRGIDLIRGMCRNLRYGRRNERNIIEFELQS